MKLRKVKKELRRAEQDLLLPALHVYLTRPADVDWAELAHGTLEAAVWMMLALDHRRPRPPDAALRKVRFKTLEVENGRMLVGAGTVTWSVARQGKEEKIVEDLQAVFHLDTVTRRRVRYEIVIGQAAPREAE